ncbi:hypothetical protein A2U01_0092578 [Trifolium medium]|uniref:Uncharacterized protein n=1 Tax=Trifolium medium TaxID=97028 RepID=A0A392UHV8_9FABA|nr:hypothetical protein [Trifolium medium]
MYCQVNQLHGCYQKVSSSSMISSGGEVKGCRSVVKLQRLFSCPYCSSGRLAYAGKADSKGVNS